jgi:hypothetical protein
MTEIHQEGTIPVLVGEVLVDPLIQENPSFMILSRRAVTLKKRLLLGNHTPIRRSMEAIKS